MSNLPSASLIIGATVAFAAFAWRGGMVDLPDAKCSDTTIIRYIPIAEPPVIRPAGSWEWPIQERALPPVEHEVQTARAEETPAPAAARTKEPEPRRRHWRRHHRWHWR